MRKPEEVIAEIERRKEAEIAAIRKEGERARARMQQEAKERQKRELEAMRAARLARWEQEKRRLEQEKQAELKHRLWRVEQDLFSDLMEAIRQKLASLSFQAEVFCAWFESAKDHLPADAHLVLYVPDRWLATAKKTISGVEIKGKRMLGGFVLMDEKSGMLVDGCWERRLADLERTIRDRWREDVGKDR